jgi:hypothetical protein
MAMHELEGNTGSASTTNGGNARNTTLAYNLEHFHAQE